MLSNAVPGVQCPWQWPWKTIQTPDRVPAVGQYDEADPSVTAWRLREMEKGGVGYLIYQVEWAHEHTQPDRLPEWRKRLPSPLIMSHSADHHAENHPDSPVEFCVAIWDVSTQAGHDFWKELVEGEGWTAREVEEGWRQFGRAVATRYMTKPKYLRIDSRPVLFRGNAHTLPFYDRMFGVSPERIVGFVREEVRAVTGQDLYLVATATEHSYWPKLKSIGFDAATEYLQHSDTWEHAAAWYRIVWTEQLAEAKRYGLDFWVPATCGYDARAWPRSNQDVFIPTPAQFKAHMLEARKFARDNYDITRGMIATYSVNEHGESSSCLEPYSDQRGDKLLRAHAEARP